MVSVESILFQSYPLLSALTPEQCHAVDLNVLWIPTHEDKTAIDKLSARLDRYVVIYKKGYTPKKGHLCKMLKAAELDDNQIAEVQRVEKQLASEDKVVVVYEKPVVFNPDFKSIQR